MTEKQKKKTTSGINHTKIITTAMYGYNDDYNCQVSHNDMTSVIHSIMPNPNWLITNGMDGAL